MTNLALAISIDPDFPKLAKEMIFMGASLNPQTTNPEFLNNPRHEFNIWFDPEASHIALGTWKKIVCTPVDISVKTADDERIDRAREDWVIPSVALYRRLLTLVRRIQLLMGRLRRPHGLTRVSITKKETRFMDIDLDRGAGYGNILDLVESDRPKVEVQPVEIQVDLDTERFYKTFVDLLAAPTPKPH